MMHQKNIDFLKDKQLKVTPQRLAVLDVLQDAGHLTADMIYKELIPRFPTMSLATVYNTLDTMAQTGLVSRIAIVGDNKVYFEMKKAFHHHFYCNACNAIYDLRLGCDNACQTSIEGHKITDTHAYFSGVCKDCQK